MCLKHTAVFQLIIFDCLFLSFRKWTGIKTALSPLRSLLSHAKRYFGFCLSGAVLRIWTQEIFQHLNASKELKQIYFNNCLVQLTYGLKVKEAARAKALVVKMHLVYQCLTKTTQHFSFLFVYGLNKEDVGLTCKLWWVNF